MKRWRGWRLAVLALAGLGCSETATGPERALPARVRVNVPSAELQSLGDTLRLVAEVLDAAGKRLPEFAVRWRFDRPGVLDTTSDAGVFRALRAGQVRVWAELAPVTGSVSRLGYRVDTASASVVVVVAQRPASISLVTPERTLWAHGARTSLSPTVRDARGFLIDGVSSLVRWTSLDTTVVAVDSLGTVRAVRDGIARIRAGIGEVSAEVPVRVSATIALNLCVSYEGGESAPCAALQFTVRERSP